MFWLGGPAGSCLHEVMGRLLFALFLLLALPVGGEARPADGVLIDRQPCSTEQPSYDAWLATQVKNESEEVQAAAKLGVIAPPAAGLTEILPTRAEYEAALATAAKCELLFYGSDGLKVAAYLWTPPAARAGARLPVIVMLRGGNRDFSKFGPNSQRRMHAFTSAGFIVLGVQYRGVDGGEGKEEFGGDDVHDVLNAVELARRLPGADPRNIFLWGESRGGMMLYLALRDGAKVNAAAALYALADLPHEAERRPDIVQNVWAQLIPDFAEHSEQALRSRSAVGFIDNVETPPILILQGSADWRVDPDESLQIARKLQARGRPYALHVFENDVHRLPWNWRERDRLVIDWFHKHMQRE